MQAKHRLRRKPLLRGLGWEPPRPRWLRGRAGHLPGLVLFFALIPRVTAGNFLALLHKRTPFPIKG